jgi:hypothetical protein
VKLSGNGQTTDDGQGNTVADGVAVILTNPSSTTGSYKVIQAQDLDDGSTCSPDPSCCQPVGNGGYVPIESIVQIPAFAQYAVQIGACVNMTLDIQVQQLVNGALVWQSCSTLSANFVNAQVQQVSDLPNEVQAALVVAESQTASNQASITAAMYANLLSLIAVSSPVIANSTAFQAYIASQIAAVNSISTNPANFTALFPTVTLGGATYDSDLAAIKNAATTVNNNNDDSAALGADVVAELQKLPGLFAQQNASLADLYKQIDKAQAALDKFNSEGGLPSLSGLPGLPDISLPSLATIVEVLLIGALCVVCFFVLKFLLGYFSAASSAAGAAGKYIKLAGEPDTPQSHLVRKFKTEWDSGILHDSGPDEETLAALTKRRHFLGNAYGGRPLTPSRSENSLQHSR